MGLVDQVGSWAGRDLGPNVEFTNGQIKLFADGAFYSQLMQLTEPGYLDGHHGEWLMTPEALEEGARTYWGEGMQIHVHANGDLGVDVTLDVLEKMLGEAPRDDHRFTLHHFGDSRPDQATRLAELGGGSERTGPVQLLRQALLHGRPRLDDGPLR